MGLTSLSAYHRNRTGPCHWLRSEISVNWKDGPLNLSPQRLATMMRTSGLAQLRSLTLSSYANCFIFVTAELRNQRTHQNSFLPYHPLPLLSLLSPEIIRVQPVGGTRGQPVLVHIGLHLRHMLSFLQVITTYRQRGCYTNDDLERCLKFVVKHVREEK